MLRMRNKDFNAVDCGNHLPETFAGAIVVDKQTTHAAKDCGTLRTRHL
jgi:hypothetical protein